MTGSGTGRKKKEDSLDWTLPEVRSMLLELRAQGDTQHAISLKLTERFGKCVGHGTVCRQLQKLRKSAQQ